jgi:CubicO group peptidase (beta-lactamase class C family)
MSKTAKQLSSCLFVYLALSAIGTRPDESPTEAPGLSRGDRERLRRLERQFDELRTLLKIPGMSAAAVRDQEVLWARGFGFADLEKKTPATPDTVYHIASLTKTFASTLLMRLVEEGKLDLDEPASRYSPDFKDDRVRVRHLLSHTSGGTPGDRYQYDGNRYAYLTAVIEKKYGKSFRELVVRTFLEPLRMTRSVPGHDVVDERNKYAPILGQEALARYERVLRDLAQPYRLYGDAEIVHTPYPPRGLNASAGLLSTVRDLAKYNAAIDRHEFLQTSTQEQAWTPAISNDGKTLPHALGWFAEKFQGERLIWHYGYWPGSFSALLLKVPARKCTLIVLANSDGLSAPFYSTGGVETSAFASCFLRLFVFEQALGRTLSDPRWTLTPEQFTSELARLRKEAGGYGYESEQLAHASMTRWLEERRARTRTPARVDPKIYARYVGQYRFGPNRVFTVSREGDQLMIDIPRDQRSALFPASEETYYLKVLDDVELTFVSDGRGPVNRIDIRAPGQKISAARINEPPKKKC